MDSIALVIITALISGLLATLVTIWWQQKTELHNRKMRVFETLMAYRYMISAQESVNALNSIDVVFYSDKNVRKAYQDFINETGKNQETSVSNIEDKHLKLLEVMSQSLGLKDIHWDNIKMTYYPTGLAEKLREEASLRKMQLQNMADELARRETSNTTIDNSISEQELLRLLPVMLQNPESLKTILEFSKQQDK